MLEDSHLISTLCRHLGEKTNLKKSMGSVVDVYILAYLAREEQKSFSSSASINFFSSTKGHPLFSAMGTLGIGEND